MCFSRVARFKEEAELLAHMSDAHVDDAKSTPKWGGKMVYVYVGGHRGHAVCSGASRASEVIKVGVPGHIYPEIKGQSLNWNCSFDFRGGEIGCFDLSATHRHFSALNY